MKATTTSSDVADPVRTRGVSRQRTERRREVGGLVDECHAVGLFDSELLDEGRAAVPAGGWRWADHTRTMDQSSLGASRRGR